MAISLKESRSVADLAELLYDFLPGSGSKTWKGHVSFRSVAQTIGVGDFWQQGSKQPMIVALLQRTLAERRHLFEPLMLEIVRAGITYRQKQGSPIRPEEIDKLNGLIVELGFKFPDLWDEDFKTLLQSDAGQRAKKVVDAIITEERERESKTYERSRELKALSDEYFSLYAELDRQSAGFRLEKILNRVFKLHDLDPRKPFRVVGEQIDGSFDLDHETYLLEAKWTRDPVGVSHLRVFRDKVGISAYTRGMFVSINGVTDEAKEAITRGHQPNFFAVDGYDLTMFLTDQIALVEFLRQRRRLLADEGSVFVPYQEIYKGTRARTD